MSGTSVLACALDRHEQARLIDAVRGAANIAVINSFGALHEALHASTCAIDVVVLSALGSHGESALRTIRAIVSQRPRTAIVVYCHPGWQHDTDLHGLAAAGAHQFIFGSANDTPTDVRAVILSAQSQCAAECVLQLLASYIPGPLHPLVEAAVCHPRQITDVSALAASMGVHRKTLVNMCARASFLRPAELLAWVRLTLVANLLETTGCTIETISVELSYPSPNSLRNALKRYTGRRGTDIRLNGGSSLVIQALQRRLEEVRANSLHTK